MWLPSIKWDTWNQRKPLKYLLVTKIKVMHQVDAVQKLLALLQNGTCERGGRPMARSDPHTGLKAAVSIPISSIKITRLIAVN